MTALRLSTEVMKTGLRVGLSSSCQMNSAMNFWSF